MSEILTLYTQQAQVVLDTIEREGTTRVKRAFIEAKYGEEAWVFQQAYSFYNQHAEQLVSRPEGAESGIWCYVDERWAVSGAGGYLLKLEVPREAAVLFDLRVWNRMLNLQYVGKDEADEDAFEMKMTNMGVKNMAEVFNTSFYPTIKREVQQSWQRLFTSAQDCPESYLEAGLWEIRKEWLGDTRRL